MRLIRWPRFYSSNSVQPPLSSIFNLKLLRDVFTDTINVINAEYPQVGFSGIMPYGFELLSNTKFDIKNPIPRRHYPMLGYSGNISNKEAECLTWILQAKLFYKLNHCYPSFYANVAYASLHNRGQYSRVNAFDQQQLLAGKVDSIHFELVQLDPNSYPTILDHYAHNIVCVFAGTASSSVAALPENREYLNSKTRRNRLMQLYLMCEALANRFFPNQSLTERQESLLQQTLFEQRKLNPTEYIRVRELGCNPMPPTAQEMQIYHELLMPRFQQFAKLAREGHGELKLVESMSYYNSNERLMGQIDEQLLEKMTHYIKENYLGYANVLELACPGGSMHKSNH